MVERRNDWITWGGGKMPVPADTKVWIRIAAYGWNDERSTPEIADWFDSLGWWADRGQPEKVRIIAYRIADEVSP